MPTAATHFAVLQRDTRVRRWVVAAVLGANAGLFANLVLHWSHAVLAAMATVAGLLLWDSRHGNLTGWWPSAPTLHRLAAVAARLERQGWVTLPSPVLPGQDTTHCYLFIGRGGLFVVEARFRPDTATVPHIRAVAAAAHDRLSGHLPAEVPVHPVMAVFEGPAPQQPRTVDSVTVVPAADLVRYLRDTESVLRPPEVAGLGEAARQAFTSR